LTQDNLQSLESKLSRRTTYRCRLSRFAFQIDRWKSKWRIFIRVGLSATLNFYYMHLYQTWKMLSMNIFLN